MKNNNKKNHFIEILLAGFSWAVPIILFIFILLHISSFYHVELEHIKDKCGWLFKESVNEDFQNRSKVLTGNVTFVPQQTTTTSSDSCIFMSETIELKTPRQQSQSLDEKMIDFLQSVLAVKNPINVYQLNSIFQQKLKEENIHLETAICLTDTINKKNNSCTHFNIASFIPLFTEPYMVSSIGINLKSYIKIHRLTLIKCMPALYWIVLFGWLLFTSSIIYAWFCIRKKVPVLIKEKELNTFKQTEKIENNPNIHIFSPCLTFDKSTRKLLYNGDTVKLTRQQQQLLIAFCNAPENTCSIDDLHTQVWKGTTVEENTIQQAISRLNTELKKIPDIQIEYVFKDSYRLTARKEKIPITNTKFLSMSF